MVIAKNLQCLSWSIACAFFLGCGDDSNDTDDNGGNSTPEGPPTAARGTLSSTDVSTFLLAFNEHIGSISSTHGIETRYVPKERDCAPAISGESRDEDSDGYPLAEIRTFDCFEGGPDVDSRTSTGIVRLSDLDDTTPGIKGGFFFEFEDYIYKFENEDRSVVNQTIAKGTWSVERDEDKLQVKTELKLGEGTDAPGIELGTFATFFLTIDDEPMDMENPVSGGNHIFSGFIRYQIESESDERDLNVDLKVESKDLTYRNHADFDYTNGCKLTEVLKNGGHNAGSITLTDGAGSTLSFTYDDCTKTILYNGETLDP